MAIDKEKLLALQIPTCTQSYCWRDTVLYALGAGYAIDPMDERQLRFVDESRLCAVPTMANVLAHPGFWMRDLGTGIDWVRVVHGEQQMRIHHPLPVEGEVIGHTRVVDVVDKGAAKGALVVSERRIVDARDGRLYATLRQTTMCRGDGGFSGASIQVPLAVPVPAPQALPEREPDIGMILPTQPNQALIYRLSGDLNPLHANPDVARRAGFDRPIFHGLGTFGVVGHALMAGLCDYRPERVREMEARFSAPVFPGDRVRVDIWHATRPGEALFRARVEARNSVVLSNGVFGYEP